MCMRVQHRYYCVGLPVGYLLGFHSPLAVYGLACGVTLGTWVHACLYGWLVSKIDWSKQSRIAVARSRGDGSATIYDGEEEEEEGGDGEHSKETASLLSSEPGVAQDRDDE